MPLINSISLHFNKRRLDLKRIALMGALVLLYFLTHLPKLNYDEINPDAINWHYRSEQYIDAIKSRDFVRTYQHYHPGVTLMLIMGPPVEILKRISEPKVGYNMYSYGTFHFVAKYALNMVLLTLVVLSVFLLSKLVGFRAAYLTGIFLTIEPFFLGNSRILHMDILLSLFMFLALSAFFISFVRKSKEYLVLGSVFLGLAFWTKNVSLLLYVFIVGTVFVLAFLRQLKPKIALVSVSVILSGFFVVGMLILPALWVRPDRVFSKMIGGSSEVVEKGHEQKFFGTKTENPGLFFYPIVFAFKLSPFMLLGLLVALGWLVKDLIQDRKKLLKSQRLFLYFLLAYFLFYFAAVEYANKKIDRYLLPLYPLIFTFVSYYFLIVIAKLPKSRAALLLLLTTLLFAWPLLSYYPYYFIYNSPLFGGNPAAEQVIGQKSFGMGVFEVRDFIRQNYGYVRVGFVDRKPIASIYPNSMVFDIRQYDPGNYEIMVLDSDEIQPNKTKGKMVLDKSIKINGVNFWNFYVKTPQTAPSE